MPSCRPGAPLHFGHRGGCASSQVNHEVDLQASRTKFGKLELWKAHLHTSTPSIRGSPHIRLPTPWKISCLHASMHFFLFWSQAKAHSSIIAWQAEVGGLGWAWSRTRKESQSRPLGPAFWPAWAHALLRQYSVSRSCNSFSFWLPAPADD